MVGQPGKNAMTNAPSPVVLGGRNACRLPLFLLVCGLLMADAATAQAVAVRLPGQAFPEVPAHLVRDAGPFAIRGYHQHLFPDQMPLEAFHERLQQLRRLDYNLVIFGLGHPGKATITMRADGTIEPIGCGTKGLRQLVAQALDLGLEPVFGMKYIGKQLPLVKKLLEEHPQLVLDRENRATVLNAAYRFPDGRDAYTATALAMVDYLLGLYPPERTAKYFLFGIDEFSSDDMAALAGELGMTPPQAFAHCLNLGTDHVLARGVTPLVWGDMMLTGALGTAEHGIALPGYQPDPRLQQSPGGAYHATYKSSTDASLHRMVNHLRDRDRITVVDWHYSPSATGEFPSVDYFQSVGFKDVWGAPWRNATNIKQFSRYAAYRGCGGMVATAWHAAYSPSLRACLRMILHTSGAYFHQPSLEPPDAPPVSYVIRAANGEVLADEKAAGIVSPEQGRLAFRADVPDGVTPAEAWLLLTTARYGVEPIELPLSFEAAGRILHTEFELPALAERTSFLHYQIRYGFTDSASGLYLPHEAFHGLVVSRTLPRIPEAPGGALLHADFGALNGDDLRRLLWVAGTCGGPLGVGFRREPTDPPRAGGLDAERLDRAWLYPSSALNRALCQGMAIELDVKMTGTFEGNDYCALLTKGSFHTGFRILVRRDARVLFQFAGIGEGGPLWLHSAEPLPKERWTVLSLVYSAPREGDPGRASIAVDGRASGQTLVPIAMPESSAVWGLGCEFTDPSDGPRGKQRPNFPGLIRRVTVRPVGVTD